MPDRSQDEKSLGSQADNKIKGDAKIYKIQITWTEACSIKTVDLIKKVSYKKVTRRTIRFATEWGLPAGGELMIKIGFVSPILIHPSALMGDYLGW